VIELGYQRTRGGGGSDYVVSWDSHELGTVGRRHVTDPQTGVDHVRWLPYRDGRAVGDVRGYDTRSDAAQALLVHDDCDDGGWRPEEHSHAEWCTCMKCEAWRAATDNDCDGEEPTLVDQLFPGFSTWCITAMTVFEHHMNGDDCDDVTVDTCLKCHGPTDGDGYCDDLACRLSDGDDDDCDSEPFCELAGTCHGPLVWCDVCGDVGADNCDDDDCDGHRYRVEECDDGTPGWVVYDRHAREALGDADGEVVYLQRADALRALEHYEQRGELPLHDADGNGTPCRRCEECSGEEHHWSEALVETSGERPDHPAAKAGHEAWYICKHCPAWRVGLDGDGDGDGDGRSVFDDIDELDAILNDTNTPRDDGDARERRAHGPLPLVGDGDGFLVHMDAAGVPDRRDDFIAVEAEPGSIGEALARELSVARPREVLRVDGDGYAGIPIVAVPGLPREFVLVVDDADLAAMLAPPDPLPALSPDDWPAIDAALARRCEKAAPLTESPPLRGLTLPTSYDVLDEDDGTPE
jgi:hypothetical protein